MLKLRKRTFIVYLREYTVSAYYSQVLYMYWTVETHTGTAISKVRPTTAVLHGETDSV